MLLILRNPIETALNKKSLSLGYGAVYWTFFFRPVTGSSQLSLTYPKWCAGLDGKEESEWEKDFFSFFPSPTALVAALVSKTTGNESGVKFSILISSTYTYSFMKVIRLHFSKISPQYLHSYPSNFQAQYRLGSCLSACKRYSEALEPFSRSLQLLLDNPSSTEHDKVDTLNHVLSVALKHPGTSTFISFIHINAKQYFKEQRYH